jgi:hypothetical protein
LLARAPSVPSVSSQDPIAQADVPTQSPSYVCPMCKHPFFRKQERNRHMLSILPRSIFCPFAQCAWRGDRYHNLSKHWEAKHLSFGEIPSRQDCKIYDPNWLVTLVVSECPLELAVSIALSEVEGRAPELDKVGIWKDWWGRKSKKCARRRPAYVRPCPSSVLAPLVLPSPPLSSPSNPLI